jgi:hypothetical protein
LYINRFVDYTGELDQRIFAKNFEFLHSKRGKEIDLLSHKVRNTKNTEKKTQLQQELYQLKQQHNERQIALNVMDKVDSIRKEDQTKVKQGIKEPYFMKESMKKKLLAEEKFSQLKSTGKVHKFLQRKEKKSQLQLKKQLSALERNDRRNSNLSI